MYFLLSLSNCFTVFKILICSHLRTFVILFCCFFSTCTDIVSQSIGELSCGTNSLPSDNIPASSPSAQNCVTGGSRLADVNSFNSDHVLDIVPNQPSNKIRIRSNVILMQNSEGEGNFEWTNNPEHRSFLTDVFRRVNERMLALAGGCSQSGDPIEYSSLNFEFVPNFIEIRDEFLWNHRNDPNSTTYNSGNKDYLNAINQLAQNTPGYEPGFDVIVTTDGFYHYLWDRSSDIGSLPEFNENIGGQWVYNGFWYSAFPTFDLSRPVMWHAPDMFLLYQHLFRGSGDNWQAARREQIIEYFSGVMLHEYGHYFNLGHTSICQHNYMGPAGFNSSSAYNQFSGRQVREMYEVLMFKNLRQTVICDQPVGDELTIEDDETWRVNTKVYTDIRIVSGAKLEVMCELHMQPKAQIFVERGAELHVNGGTITGCGEYWGGIRVEGFADYSNHDQSEGGLVRVDNGAVLENATNLISTNNPKYDWPESEDYYGGLVIAEDATFRDSWRGVEFLKYALFGHKDESYFKNCTFEDLRIGVTDWRSDGVTFDNCTFRRIGKEGILPYNAGVVVINGCTFEDMPVGIDIINTNPSMLTAPQIVGDRDQGTENTFNCDSYGIRVESSATLAEEQLQIIGNNFDGNQVGVLLQGENNPVFERNRIENSFVNVGAVDCGNNQIFVNNSVLFDATVGAQVDGSNDGLVFLANCFDGNSNSDIRITQAATLQNPHGPGNGTKSADNHFLETSFSWDAIKNESGADFIYLSRTLDENSDYFPDNSLNVSIELPPDGNGAEVGPCADINGLVGGNDGPPNGSVYSECLGKFVSYADIPELLQGIEDPSQVIRVKYDIKDVSITTMKRCLKQLHLAYASQMIKSGTIDAAAEYLLSREEFIVKTYGYGIYVQSGNYSSAVNALEDMEFKNEDEENFIIAQEVYLDFLSSPKEGAFKFEEEAEKELIEIGASHGVYSGYARSILQVITGERLVLPLVPLKEEGKILEGSIEGQLPNEILVYPNPISDGVVHLLIPKFMRDEGLSISIQDKFGREVVTRGVPRGHASVSISLPNRSESLDLFYITIKGSSGLLVTKKIVIN